MNKLATYIQPILLGGKYNFGYNITHSLKMVIIKPIKEETFLQEDLSRWCLKAKWYQIHKNEDNTCEAVLYFDTINKGSEARIALRWCIKDYDVKVMHPNFVVWGSHPQQYWAMLSLITSLPVNPLTLQELKAPRQKHMDKRRHVIIENVPEYITDEDLVNLFPGVKETIVYNYDPEAKGIVLLEFETIDHAIDFIETHSEVQIKGKFYSVTAYEERLDQWHKESVHMNRDQFGEQDGLNDTEREQYFEQWHFLQNQKIGVLEREDLTGQQQIQEHYELHAAQKPLKLKLDADTKRRISLNVETHDKPHHEIKSVNALIKDKGLPSIISSRNMKRHRKIEKPAQKVKYVRKLDVNINPALQNPLDIAANKHGYKDSNELMMAAMRMATEGQSGLMYGANIIPTNQHKVNRLGNGGSQMLSTATSNNNIGVKTDEHKTEEDKKLDAFRARAIPKSISQPVVPVQKPMLYEDRVKAFRKGNL